MRLKHYAARTRVHIYIYIVPCFVLCLFVISVSFVFIKTNSGQSLLQVSQGFVQSLFFVTTRSIRILRLETLFVNTEFELGGGVCVGTACGFWFQVYRFDFGAEFIRDFENARKWLVFFFQKIGSANFLEEQR